LKKKKTPQGTLGEDPLLESLVFLTKYFGNPKSAETLKAGFPLSHGQFSPSLFVKSSERVGLKARVVKRDLKNISHMVLPVVLVLDNQRACILLEILEDDNLRVILPETGCSEEIIRLSDLANEYTGYSIFIKVAESFKPNEYSPIPEKSGSWFWGAILQNKWMYGQVGLAAIFINLFALASPFFIMIVYDRVVPNDAKETLWVLASGIAIVIIFDILLKTLRSYFIDFAGKKADIIISNRIYNQVLDMYLAHRPGSAGAFANTLREFETLRDFFTSATLVSVIDLPFSLLFIFVLWLVAGPVVIVLIVAVVLILSYGLLIQVSLNKTIGKNYKEQQSKHGVLVETINGLETIKTIGAEARMRRQWEEAVGRTARSSQAAKALSGSSANFAGMIQQLTSVGLVLYGVYLISKGEMTVGALIACVMLGGRSIAPLAKVAQLLTRFSQSVSSYKALQNLMDTPIERPVNNSFVHRPDILGDITFSSVSFTYPGRKEKALDNVSFTIRSGDKVGILGRVGSGKSTIAKLALGIYKPESGTIYIDGTDINQIDPADLRKNVGYVAQEPFLFRGTIKDNICAASPFVDLLEIVQAAKMAGIDSFVKQSPMGFDMPVGERGDGLSGGQRQGVTVARAILKKPNVLLLDEPTSSMDPRSEHQLKESLTPFIKKRTVLLTTHRSSMLSLVDRILMLDNGKLVADGDKDDVLKRLGSGNIAARK
jgi:ATP-binding cassette subfamily C protein LapB